MRSPLAGWIGSTFEIPAQKKFKRLGRTRFSQEKAERRKRAKKEKRQAQSEAARAAHEARCRVNIVSIRLRHGFVYLRVIERGVPGFKFQLGRASDGVQELTRNALSVTDRFPSFAVDRAQSLVTRVLKNGSVSVEIEEEI